MSKRNSERITQPELAVPVVTVPCQFRAQAAAFQLGASDGFNKTHRNRTFLLPVSASAYAAGLLAGVAARSLKLKR